MNNIIFCFDKNYSHLLSNVLKTFLKFNQYDRYKIYFILYDESKELHNFVKKTISNIDLYLNYEYTYFEPTEEFKKIIKNYEYILYENDEESKKSSVFCNYGNWSRFFINEIFPHLETGLYLDIDILINGNLNDVFNINYGNNIIGAIGMKNKNRNQKRGRVLDYDKSQIESIIKNFKDIDKSKFKDIINFDTLNSQRFNCGVVYFNFKLYKENKILDKLISLLKELNNKNIKIMNTGTEKTFNIIVSKYKNLDEKYNKIIGNKVKLENINFKDFTIFHFKGKKNLLNDKIYQDILNKISS